MRARFDAKFLIGLAAAIVAVVASFSTKAERLPIKIYTSADGLGTSASFNLVRDARGFIWLCSRDGLVRFDGYRFTTYRIGDESADPAVFDLLPTSTGDYWINLNRGTDYRFSSVSDEIDVELRPSGGDVRVPFPAEGVTGMAFPRFEDDSGNLWTANSDGLYLLRKEGEIYSSEVIHLELPENPTGLLTTVEFRNARGDGFWVGTNWGVIRRLPDGQMFHTSVNPDGNSDLVRAFAEDNDERLWIAQPDGLIVVKTRPTPAMANTKANVRVGKLSPDGMADLPDAPDEAVKFGFDELLSGFSPRERSSSDFTRPAVVNIFSGSDGKIWITTNQGLITFDGTRFRHFTTKNGVATNDLGAITEGLDGSIWIASYGGLHRLNPTGMTSFDEFDGLELARIHAISEDRGGRLQTVSGNFNVSSFDGSKFEMARPHIPADEIFTWQSNVGLRDSRDDWWLHTNKTLYRFSGTRSVRELEGRRPDAAYNETNGLIGGNVLKVFEDSGGNLWFTAYQSAEQKGLSRLDRQTGEFRSYTSNDGLPDAAMPTGFVEDHTGTLWFGFVEGGIARYRDGEFSMVENEDAPKGGITGMFGDHKGRIWIATNRDGLIQIEDPQNAKPTFRRFTTADGLTSNNIRCITEDNFGNIYAGTVRGVNRLTPETGRVLYYGVADGLASDFVSSMFRDRHGDIWIGTFNGLSRLKPVPAKPAEPPQILISGLSISGEDYSVSPLGQAEVNVPDQSPEKGNIQIDFLSAGSSFSAPVRYQHRFDGDDDWSAPSPASSVTFANVAAGSYRFFVRAVNADGIASVAPAAVNFTILRPIWQRWWFLLSAAVVLATLIYCIYRYRVAQLVKLERVRTRIASDLHDDIGSSLSQIAILSEVARQRSGDNGATEPLKLIADTSREMVDSMSDIVWAINPLKDKLDDLIHRMRRFAEDTLDAKDIEYRFVLPKFSRDLSLGADVRREVYLIFKECVNNLVKHSDATEALISVYLDGDDLQIEVSDNGRGFDVSRALSEELESYGGNGLPNMRKRAESLGGTFQLSSESGGGAKMVLRVPVGQRWARSKRRRSEKLG